MAFILALKVHINNIMKIKLTYISFSFLSILLFGVTSVLADTLYTELGEAKGINHFVTKAVEFSHSDKRIAFLFEDTDDKELIKQISDQVCFLSKGPCEYEGLDMVEAHSGMEITEAEFDIFVEIVIDAMEMANIPHTARNKLLALLSPMREDIIYQ
jgi:hemoglobin